MKKPNILLNETLDTIAPANREEEREELERINKIEENLRQAEERRIAWNDYKFNLNICVK